MAHGHSRQPRTLTLNVPRIPVRRLISTARRRLRCFEQQCERHWPMTAYALLTLAAMAYVIEQLTTI